MDQTAQSLFKIRGKQAAGGRRTDVSLTYNPTGHISILEADVHNKETFTASGKISFTFWWSYYINEMEALASTKRVVLNLMISDEAKNSFGFKEELQKGDLAPKGWKFDEHALVDTKDVFRIEELSKLTHKLIGLEGIELLDVESESALVQKIRDIGIKIKLHDKPPYASWQQIDEMLQPILNNIEEDISISEKQFIARLLECIAKDMSQLYFDTEIPVKLLHLAMKFEDLSYEQITSLQNSLNDLQAYKRQLELVQTKTDEATSKLNQHNIWAIIMGVISLIIAIIWLYDEFS
ncbi:hypothetical protein BKI52_24940 [marine bacterium AO1-C]|nr:hypothetical protein BKI52_24940 [marine bacterium AO1-C]